MQNYFNDDEIDIADFIASIARNKKLIGTLSLLFFLIGFIYASTKKIIWQGEFQIVLEDRNSSFQNNIELPPILSKSNNSQNINTEVAILKSPSVLLDIFEFVKKEKIKNSNSSFKNLRFNSWRKNSIDVELDKGTTVLNFSYQDENKELIIPVLERISKAYQEFSGRKRKRNIKLALDFLEKQIPIYKEKSNKAILEVQEFSVENDLLFNNNLITSVDLDEDKSSIITPPDLDIDLLRIKFINEIKFLENSKKKALEINETSDEIIFFAENIEGFQNVNLANLTNLKNQLSESRLIYKEDDIAIENLKRFINSSTKNLKSDVIDFINVKKELVNKKLKSIDRPKKVLDEYRVLLSEAYTNKITLNKLEKEFREILLEKGKTSDPWELITEPNLLPYPQNKNSFLISILSLILGGSIGAILGYVREKNDDQIFSLNKLKAIGDWPFLYILENNNISIIEYLDLIIEKTSRETKKSIALLKVGDSKEFNINYLEGVMKNKFETNSFSLTSNSSDVLDYDSVIFLIQLGLTKESEIIDTYAKVKLTNSKILGLLALKNNDKVTY